MENTINVSASENISTWDNTKATYASNGARSSHSLDLLEGRKPGYLKDDEFFEILMHAYSSTYGYSGVNHPGDLYVNISTTLEIVSNTLSALVDLNFGRELRDVKNS